MQQPQSPALTVLHVAAHVIRRAGPVVRERMRTKVLVAIAVTFSLAAASAFYLTVGRAALAEAARAE